MHESVLQYLRFFATLMLPLPDPESQITFALAFGLDRDRGRGCGRDRFPDCTWEHSTALITARITRAMPLVPSVDTAAMPVDPAFRISLDCFPCFETAESR